MRMARVIARLRRRREFLVDRYINNAADQRAHTHEREEAMAIEVALPILEREHQRRAVGFMEKAAASAEAREILTAAGWLDESGALAYGAPMVQQYGQSLQLAGDFTAPQLYALARYLRRPDQFRPDHQEAAPPSWCVSCGCAAGQIHAPTCSGLQP